MISTGFVATNIIPSNPEVFILDIMFFITAILLCIVSSLVSPSCGGGPAVIQTRAASLKSL